MKNQVAALENSFALSFNSWFRPMTAAYWYTIPSALDVFRRGDTDIQGHLVDKLHRIAGEHDGYDPPVNLTSESPQFCWSGLDGSVRILNIPIGLVEVLIVSAISLFGDRMVCVRTRSVSARGVALDIGDGVRLGVRVHCAQIQEILAVYSGVFGSNCRISLDRGWGDVKSREGENNRHGIRDGKEERPQRRRGCGGLGRALHTRQAQGDWIKRLKDPPFSHLLHGVCY